MTAPAILAAAREAVALEERSRWGPARFVQPDDDDEGVACDRQRSAELDWQQHALANCPAIAAALLEAEAEIQRLTAEREARWVAQEASRGGSTAEVNGEPMLTGTVSITPYLPYIDHGCDKLPDGSQLWAVSFPGLPGCIAQGGTLAEALTDLARLVPMCCEQVTRSLEEVCAERNALQAELTRLRGEGT